MPIISKVESKSWRGRLLFAIIFVVLSVGGLTMIYPFGIMIAGSTRSAMDQADMSLVPRFLVDRDPLYRKFLETKYNADILDLNSAHGRNNLSFKAASVPQRIFQQRVDDFEEFFEEAKLPDHWQVLGGIVGANKIAPENHRKLQDALRTRFDDNLAEFSRVAGTPLISWTRVAINIPDFMTQRYDFPLSPTYEEYFKLLHEAPPANRQVLSLSGYFLDSIAYPDYGKVNTEKYNKAHPTSPQLKEYGEFVLPRTAPPASQAKLREEWKEFIQKDLHPSFVVADVPADAYRKFLTNRYGDVEQLNQTWKTSLKSFDEINLPTGKDWLHGVQGKDYLDFINEQPEDKLRLVGPEYEWRDWLKKKYGTLDKLNAAHNATYASFDHPAMPQDQLELQYVEQNSGSLRTAYATRNYAVVLRELVTQGTPFWNTLIVCGFTVVLTLLVNPAAAYAMSRFQLPGTYKILLLLMVTTAFPPMVVLVPKFLILRETGLLNTFAALIIPFIANGYLIFLLKGFFDSLPTTLYEAALIDGAGETRMFFEITMALSKPILAVVALQAFNSAYTMFLYSLIVCPRPDMWTLNVWLYQWQTNMGMPGVFAALLISALPTLVMFLLAQNVIMKGIVVPVEK